MSHLKPQKLHVSFIDNIDPLVLSLPRKYTLTHSDRTGDLFLTIAKSYNLSQISKLATKFMRDEVLAEWQEISGEFSLHLYCHVSGGLILGPAGWRMNIFRAHLPMVLEAFYYGDRNIYSSNNNLLQASAIIHFRSHINKYNIDENWGIMNDHKIVE